MNFSKHSNLRHLRLLKTTESFQTNFNLCLVSFDCAIYRLCRGREPTTSPREQRSGGEEMSWQWFHIRLVRSADQNVWIVPLAGSCFRILCLTGWSRFSIAPTQALLLNTSLNNDELISLCKFSDRPALPQKIGNQPIPHFLPMSKWFRDPALLLDVAGLCNMDARDVSSRWISACWISTPPCWFRSTSRSPQKVFTKALTW